MSKEQQRANIVKCNAVRGLRFAARVHDELSRACDDIAPGRETVSRSELLPILKAIRKNAYARGHSAASNREYRRRRLLQTELDAAVSGKDLAYSERDKLVCALSKLFPAYLMLHPDDAKWDKDWRWIVCINLPAGQATWHVHLSELPWFAHLERRDNDWDQHSTDEKYKRLSALEPRYMATREGTVDTAHVFVGRGIDSRAGSAT